MRIWIRHFVRWDYKNMLNQFSRTELLLGKAAMERLAECRVAVFGIGGVGGYVCEALARSGIGAFDLIDDDRICLTNINRQIIATRKTVGRYKADVMMGAGNKLDPTAFRVADIYKTKVDPLARVMRRELKKRGVKNLKVVYSEEQPIRPIEDMAISCRSHCICPPGTKRHCTDRRDIPGSTAFVPSAAGLIIAGYSVSNVNLSTVIACKEDGVKHLFLDSY